MSFFGKSSGKFKFNKVVLTMVYSDFLMLSAAGFLTPIYAIFVTGQIKGATVATVGFVSTIFFVVKSAAQIPISAYVDSQSGEEADWRALFLGSAIVSLVPLLYYFFAHEVWHLFVIEALHGIGYAFALPTWLAIYSRHIEKDRESSQWALHSNAIGLGAAATAAVGGVLAEHFGFRILFLLITAMSIMGTLTLLQIKNDLHKGEPDDEEKDDEAEMVAALESVDQKEIVIG